MSAYRVETRLSPEQVMAQATAYFGPGGLGLERREENPCCLYFEGGGGHILVSASTGDKTTVDLETREWDYHVKKFMGQIG